MSWKNNVLSLLASQDYATAAQVCEEIATSHPEEIEAFFYLGVAYLLQGGVEEAQGVWMSGMFESPADLDGEERNQALIGILREQAQQNSDRGNWKNSQLLYEQLQELTPDDVNTQLTLVKTALQAGNLTSDQLEEWQVIEHLQQAETEIVNSSLLLEIIKLAFDYPVPKIEPLIASAFNHLQDNPQLKTLAEEKLETLHLLGATAYENQQYESAVTLLRYVIDLKPDVPFPYSDLANALKELGDLEGAKENYEKALSIDPEIAIIHYNLGNLYRGQGNLDAALTCYEKALSLNSMLDRVYINLALVSEAKGNRTQAIQYYKDLLGLYPKHPEAHNNLGLLLGEQGNLEEAEEYLKRSIELKPGYADAYNNLGLLYQIQGKPEEAANNYEQAITCYHQNQARKHDLVKANQNFGFLFFEQNDLERAEYCYQQALNIEPSNANLLILMGILYQEKEQVDQAINYYNQALEADPEFPHAHHNLANAYREKGDLEAAFFWYDKTFQIAPNSVKAHYSFSESHKFKTEEDSYFQKLLELRESKEITYTNRKYIEFSLAKAYLDMGKYHEEFACLEKGNAMKRAEIKYSVEQDLDRFEAIKTQFNVENIAKFNLINTSGRTPILIIGMPRSGTTLTEQIISSHSKVAGLGELRFLGIITSNNKSFTENFNEVSKETLVEAQNQYLEQVAERDNQAPYFTDKMPYNFMCLGLIKLLFPNAKVIHCLRHPLDVCMANYQRCFRAGNYHSYSLEDLGKYYLGYHQLMEHWYSLFPDFLYPLHYEKLVTNQEEESKKLIEFCGLEWEDNILNFHENKRSVRTASVVQVRQKLYTSSANKWQRYAKHLEPLKQFFEENGIL